MPWRAAPSAAFLADGAARQRPYTAAVTDPVDADQVPPSDQIPPSDTPGTPTWVKAFVAVVVVLALVFLAAMLLGGGEHGPGQHGMGERPTGYTATT